MREASTRKLDQVWVNWAEQKTIRRILAENRLTGGRLLDAPCGYGRFWPLLGGQDFGLVGLDLDSIQVGKALSSNGTRGSLTGVCGSLFELPFPNDSFDCVLCVRFLHLQHSDEERLRILRELSRVARRLLIISIYRPRAIHRLLRRWNGTPGRGRLMTNSEYEMLTRRLGLETRSVWPLFQGVHMQTLIALEKKTSP